MKTKAVIFTEPKHAQLQELEMFLAGQDYITGQNFVVDGGRTLGPSHR